MWEIISLLLYSTGRTDERDLLAIAKFLVPYNHGRSSQITDVAREVKPLIFLPIPIFCENVGTGSTPYSFVLLNNTQSPSLCLPLSCGEAYVPSRTSAESCLKGWPSV